MELLTSQVTLPADHCCAAISTTYNVILLTVTSTVYRYSLQLIHHTQTSSKDAIGGGAT